MIREEMVSLDIRLILPKQQGYHHDGFVLFEYRKNKSTLILINIQILIIYAKLCLYFCQLRFHDKKRKNLARKVEDLFFLN